MGLQQHACSSALSSRRVRHWAAYATGAEPLSCQRALPLDTCAFRRGFTQARRAACLPQAPIFHGWAAPGSCLLRSTTSLPSGLASRCA